MRLVLDLQCTQSPAHADRGIARYATELAAALLRGGAEVALLTLNPALAFPRSLPPELLAHPGLGWASPRAYDRLDGEVAHLILSPVEEVSPESVLPPHVRASGAHVVALLFDLIPLVLDQHSSGGARAWYRQRLELYRQADLVLAISEHTRADALQHLGLIPERVVSVLGGVSSFFSPSTEGQDAAEGVAGLVRRPVLSVGGGDGRKNLDNLVRAWALVPEEVRALHQLVVVCDLPPLAVSHLATVAAEAGLADDELVVTGFVSDVVLRQLYRASALFVFPSRYEGLGLPVLEALACGCPAVTSNRSSLPEILGLPASTFDPDDQVAMAGRITAGLVDERLRTEISACAAERLARFTWDATARRVLDALSGLPEPLPPEAGRPGRPARRRRARRLALATLLPPSSSGLAVVAGRLLPELARHAEVVALTPDARRPCQAPPAVRVLVADALGSSVAPDAFDHLVSVVGNSEQHWATVENVRRHGGIVWLHEARLPAISTERATQLGLPDGWVAERQQALHPGRPLQLSEATWRDPGALSRMGVGLTGQVVRWSRGCIVNSELARRLVVLDQQPGQALPPIAVLPLAFPDPATLAGHEPDDPPLLLAPGHLDEVKGPDVLVEALARLRREVPARLAFVGPAHPSRRRWVEALAERWGVVGAVQVTGAVDDETWWAWVRRASIGVVLRRTTLGESSGAVHELLAAGVPCVTSVATALELPPDALVHVPPGVQAPQLADLLAGLLADPRRSTALAAAGQAAAAAWTYAHLAEALLPTLDALADGEVVVPAPARAVRAAGPVRTTGRPDPLGGALDGRGRGPRPSGPARPAGTGSAG